MLLNQAQSAQTLSMDRVLQDAATPLLHGEFCSPVPIFNLGHSSSFKYRFSQKDGQKRVATQTTMAKQTTTKDDEMMSTTISCDAPAWFGATKGHTSTSPHMTAPVSHHTIF